jgi:hypothetical protein
MERPETPSKIEVLAIKPINKGPLRAVCSVRLGGVTIHDFKVVKQEGKAAWVSEPSREYVGTDGKKKYFPMVELNDTLKREVTRLILGAWVTHAAAEAHDTF